MATFPVGERPTVVVEFVCPVGHRVPAYGRTEGDIFAALAPRCPKCGASFIDAQTVGPLERPPAHRYLARRAVGDLTLEVEIAADRFDEVDGVFTFFAGGHVVSRSSQLREAPRQLS